ncbi:MAG: methyl-accepting chemotaxis protein [Treponema sp.]|nr:methyl-accepting chemotaxis protein [Treponema sp.]
MSEKTSKPKSSVLSKRITILCLSLVLTISIIFTVVNLVNLGNITNRNLRSTAALTMRNLNLDIHNAILPAMSMIVNTAALAPSIQYSEMEAIFFDLMSTEPTVGELYFGSVLSRFDGGVFIVGSGLDVYNVFPDFDQVERPWFIQAVQNPGRVLITDPYIDTGTSNLCVTMAYAVRYGGAIIGVVGADVYLDVLTEIVTSRKITGDGNTFIIDKEGLYLVHPNNIYIMTENFFQREGRELRGDITSSTDVNITVKGNTYWASVSLLDLEWYIVSTGTTEEFTSDFQRLLLITVISALVLSFIAIIVSLRFSRILTKPIIRLFGILNVIASGDLTQEFEAKGKDEISQMTLLLRETQQSIKNLIFNIKEEADALSGIGNDLASDMNETASSMNEITASVQSIKGRILKQNESVVETHETLEKVVANINELNSHVENQSENISQASSAIEQMVANINSVTGTLVNNAGNVKTLLDASEAGRSGLSEVAADIQEIARESEGILEINSVMQNIASQTNLLSMNAAIEAAHAGESGKGFAVVADEIRKLAENSGAQSKTIGTVLKKIKSSIDKITSSTQNVLDKFEAIDSGVKLVAEQEEIIRNAMEEQGIGSKQILDGIGNVNDITREVKKGSNEMLEGAQVVISECEDLERATAEITSGMEEMTAGAEHINKAMNSANDTSSKNRDAINMVIQEVSRFKV